MTCMPKLISRCATSVPIRPKPRMPATLPLSSTPVNFDRFHSPALSDAAACGTLRATASSSAVACSAALTMLELGALTTITPALVAASTSTLSRPTPARATTRRFGAWASASASIFVALRTITASTSASAGSSADRSAPSTWRTSKSGSSSATAAGDSSSVTRTMGTGTAEPLGRWSRGLQSSQACESVHEHYRHGSPTAGLRRAAPKNLTKVGAAPGSGSQPPAGRLSARRAAGGRADGFLCSAMGASPGAAGPSHFRPDQAQGDNQVSRHKAGAPGCRVTRSGRGGRPDRGSRLMHSIIVLAVVACVIAVPGIAAALAAFLPGEVAIVTRTAAAFGLGYAAAGGCAFLLAAAHAFRLSFFFPLWLVVSAALWVVAFRRAPIRDQITALIADVKKNLFPLLLGAAVVAAVLIVHVRYLSLLGGPRYVYYLNGLEIANSHGVPSATLEYGQSWAPATDKIFLDAFTGVVALISNNVAAGPGVLLWVSIFGTAIGLWATAWELGIRRVGGLLPLLLLSNTLILNITVVTSDFTDYRSEDFGRAVAFCALALGIFEIG